MTLFHVIKHNPKATVGNSRMLNELPPAIFDKYIKIMAEKTDRVSLADRPEWHHKFNYVATDVLTKLLLDYDGPV